ncbi:MAG: hypothetical protein OXH69_00530 [Acidobacteria bacterium]|nr:hypothetical protein [Acidobacteriota bacterium]
MTRRHIAYSLLAFASLLVVPAAAAQETASTPRTPWGHPDLQGAWTNTTTTPLERPDDLEGREFLTQEEWAERNPGSGISAYDAGAYNDYWLEKGELSMRTSLVVDPPDGKLPALIPAEEERVNARRAAAAAGGGPASVHFFNAYDRCITRGLPGAMMPGFYNHNYHIVQTPDHVAILVEMVHEARIVPLDGTPVSGVRQWLGDSRGRWEGDTLVVETTNFAGKVTARGLTAFGGTEGLTVVERFTRVDDNTIDYQVTVTDPAIWSAPWTASIPMTAMEGTLFEYACHEGNYAMGNMLAGARAEEAR